MQSIFTFFLNFQVNSSMCPTILLESLWLSEESASSFDAGGDSDRYGDDLEGLVKGTGFLKPVAEVIRGESLQGEFLTIGFVDRLDELVL